MGSPRNRFPGFRTQFLTKRLCTHYKGFRLFDTNMTPVKKDISFFLFLRLFGKLPFFSWFRLLAETSCSLSLSSASCKDSDCVTEFCSFVTDFPERFLGILAEHASIGSGSSSYSGAAPVKGSDWFQYSFDVQHGFWLWLLHGIWCLLLVPWAAAQN